MALLSCTRSAMLSAVIVHCCSAAPRAHALTVPARATAAVGDDVDSVTRPARLTEAAQLGGELSVGGETTERAPPELLGDHADRAGQRATIRGQPIAQPPPQRDRGG